jgi:hypothetical protein
MLDVTNSFANREKYVIHPEKSTIIMRIPKKSTRFEVTDWKLGDKEVSISQTTAHLGILRSTRNDGVPGIHKTPYFPVNTIIEKFTF